MTRKEIDTYLNNGGILHYSYTYCNGMYTKEISIVKERASERFLSIIDPQESPTRYAEEEVKLKKPYKVIIEEYDSNVDTSEIDLHDYRLHEIQRFSSIDEVDTYLKCHNEAVEQIKWIIYRQM